MNRRNRHWSANSKTLTALAIFTGIGAVAFLWWSTKEWPYEPRASFQSSDANWADNEILAKGRDFHAMVYGFEMYRIQCDASDATLIRTTRRNWLNFNAWSNYKADIKWKVPYARANKAIGTYYPPVNMEHCANQGVTQQMLDLADERAKDYISSLESS